MKLLRYTIVISTLLTIGASCKKDFLEVNDNLVTTRQNYVKDLKSMEAYLNGTYVLLNDMFERGFRVAYPEVIADNLKPLSTPPQALWQHYGWAQQKNESGGFALYEDDLNANGIWRGAYLVARSCNFVIENTGQYRNQKPELADDILGQAYAIRALLYFHLVNIFAQHYSFTNDASHPGIPYITTSDITQPYLRQTVGEVYGLLVSDLTKSVDLLSATPSDIRYMNRYASMALLARIYLFKDDFASAKNMAEQVSKTVPLMMISAGYPKALFANFLPNETEVLFQATPGDLYYSNFIGSALRGDNLRFHATNDMASILTEDSNDIRNTWVENSLGEWNVTKYPINTTGNPPLRSLPESDYYQPVLRSSEMFLIVAEACAKAGEEDKARLYLDAIRTRANPGAVATTATGTALIDTIYKERRKELSFEGLRMYDLQRWKSGVTRNDVLPGIPASLPYPSNKAIAPIPMLDERLAGLSQNADY